MRSIEPQPLPNVLILSDYSDVVRQLLTAAGLPAVEARRLRGTLIIWRVLKFFGRGLITRGGSAAVRPECCSYSYVKASRS